MDTDAFGVLRDTGFVAMIGYPLAAGADRSRNYRFSTVPLLPLSSPTCVETCLRDD